MVGEWVLRRICINDYLGLNKKQDEKSIIQLGIRLGESPALSNGKCDGKRGHYLKK
jgi:hypothetical protein